MSKRTGLEKKLTSLANPGKVKNLFILFLILLFSFVFYSPSLSYFFISDDFFHISFSSIGEIVKISPIYNHYIPIFLSCLFIIKQFFGPNPFFFHIYTILVHLTNIILAYIFTREFLKSSRKALLVALCFSIFFSHYEAVYWITGTTNSLMTLFYLLSLISFQKFIKTNKNSWLVFTAILSCLAFLSHEHGIMLIPVIISYGIYKHTGFHKYKFLLLPVLLFSIVSILKIETVHLELVKIPSFLRLIQSDIKSNLYLLFPVPFLVDRAPKITLLSFCVVLLTGTFLIIKKDRKLLLCFIWLEIHILLFSSTSLPQARYFYLISIPALCLIISFLSYWRKYFQFGFYMFLLTGFIFFLSDRSNEWKETSIIMQTGVLDLKKISPEFPKDKKVYFINLPDSLNGPPWNAYLFRNGVERIIEYSYGTLPTNIYYLSTEKDNILLRNDSYINTKDLAGINDSILVSYRLRHFYLIGGKTKEEKQAQE